MHIFVKLSSHPGETVLSAFRTYAGLDTIPLGLLRNKLTHNPLVVGSSPTGPTILKAARCAAFVFLHEPWR